METSMVDVLKEVFHFADENLLNEFLYNAVVQTVPARTEIISEGSTQYSIPFLVKGIAKGSFRDADGREVTDCFSTKAGDVLAALYRLNVDSPEYIAEVAVTTLTECKLIYIPVNVINKCVTQYIEAIVLYNRILADSLAWHSSVKRMLYTRKPEARYKWFCEKYPELVQLLKEKKIKQKEIASYLNMAEQTFSKILSECNEDG